MNKKIISFLLMGRRGWGGESMGDVLGVAPAKATLDDVKKLNMRQVMQLFHAAPAPDFETIKGEYKAEVLEVGPLAFAAKFITHNIFGPGHWEGKGFFPFESNKGRGYNLFMPKNSEHPARVREMDTRVGISSIDDRDSFHLDYSQYNRFMIGTMSDEIRRINDTLLIGVGFMSIGGGPCNPAPFVVVGKPTKWVGPDR